jgi:O-antigen/teichoic acid export membrane protein
MTSAKHRIEQPPTRHLHARERRSIVLGTILRIAGTPLIAVVGLLNTAIIVHETGDAVFGLVSLITNLSLLLPFADLGIGAVITTACSKSRDLTGDRVATETIRRGLRTLCLVALGLSVIAVTLAAMDLWGWLLGSSSGGPDRIAVTLAVCLIAFGIPAGIGIRILIGLDLNHVAVLMTMSNAVFTVAITLALRAIGVPPIWYAVSAAGGVLIGNCIATAVALRLSGLKRISLLDTSRTRTHERLLAGSGWIFIASIGLPLGLQTHRLILSHTATTGELSRYALMAQVYAIAWMVFSTAGTALWPVFVKRREDYRATTRLWLQSTLLFGAVAGVAAVVMTFVGPWATSVLSSGQLTATYGLSFAFGLLLVVQCLHLPAGVMLTTPTEMRWQAFCIAAMGIVSVVLGIWLSRQWGGIGVVAATVAAVVLAQLIPDALWITRLLRQRPDAGEITEKADLERVSR